MKSRSTSDGQPRRGWFQRFLILVNVSAILTALAGAYIINNSYGRIESIERVALGGSLTPAAGSSRPGERVINVLLVGSDSAATLDDDDPIGLERQGERNGDVIIVAHIDERDSSAALVSIPRDLWVPIAGRDREAKINSAFAVGGPAMLIETIEQNFGIPINHYVNVDFAGFQGLVDALGEVSVWFDQPARDWNTRTNTSQTGFQMLEAGCQPLDGPTALAYVRSRYYQTLDDDGVWVSEQASDLNRIRRQQDFLKQVAAKAINSGSRNPFVFDGLIDAAIEHVTLDQDLSPSLLLDLGGAFRQFDSNNLQAYSLPAEFGWVGSSSVLFLNPDQAEPILELFRGARPTDPRTVRVEMVHTSGTGEAADALARSFLIRGFGDIRVSPAPLLHSGIEVRYGPNEASVAQVVADQIAEPVRLVEVGGLPPRSVVVAFGQPVAPDEATVSETATDDLTDAVPADGSKTDANAPGEEPAAVSQDSGFSAASCGR
ncbi:MAG: LCP family protein [Acidimicrobiales bacterium]|nr:LCP family protein [Acidimicrobiales bacterium]